MITAAHWKRVASRVLDPAAGWAHRAKLTYQAPVGWALRGVLGEGSGFRANEVYVWAVVMPLFVPSLHLSLNFSQRVPGGVTTFGISDLSAFETAIALAADGLPSESEALRMVAESDAEESGYARLLLGDIDGAAAELARPFHVDDVRDFVEAARERRAQILLSLESGESEAAVDQLRTWRDATARAVRVA